VKAFLAALPVCAAIAAPWGGDATDRTTRTVRVTADPRIRLDATIADLAITGSDRSDVTIDVVRHAPAASDLDRYPVSIVEEAGGLQVNVVQTDQGRDARLKAEIVMAVPASALLESVRVFEGRVKLANLHGVCDVDLRRGAVDAERVGGRVRLEAGIGSVDVRDAELTPGGMMRLRVFNGPLNIRFARRPANARILAVTFNGRLSSDIPLTLKDKFGPRFGETTLGNGDPVMSLDVVKGDIAIRVERDGNGPREGVSAWSPR